jgi:hypothetical protein
VSLIADWLLIYSSISVVGDSNFPIVSGAEME